MRLAIAIVAIALMLAGVYMVVREGSDGNARTVESKTVSVERLRARVIRRHPHKRDAFTQGLLWHDGAVYESTGREGHSSLRMVELESGEVLRQRQNGPREFAEGLALVDDLLFQLTWRNGRALVFRRDDFTPVREHAYEGEGWGLCYDGASLVMSDGSDKLVFRDPITFAEQRTVRVSLASKPVVRLNELECVAGVVWANVWKQSVNLRIDPSDGRVTAVVDATGLLTPEEQRGAKVLNGIAWMPERNHFLITGKHWPWMFEVSFERP